jgi:predicted DNA-binding transcriptional regulator YafY
MLISKAKKQPKMAANLHCSDFFVNFYQKNMARHKEALIRYRIIDECLRNRKLVTINELIDACRDNDIIVSERTIREDIRNMKYDLGLGYDAPIENIRPKKYRYSDPDYSINKLPLSDDEVDALGFAARLLQQFGNTSPFNQITGSVQKIFNHLKIRNSLDEKEFDTLIDFEKAPETKGLQFLELLLGALRKKQVVKIEYRHFGSERKRERIVHPYLLKEYHNRWYLYGLAEDVNETRLFGLDRIENVKRHYGIAYKTPTEHPKDHFKNLIGVTKFPDTEPEQILLKFNNWRTPYLLTQPLHKSQEVVEQTNSHTVFSYYIHQSPELLTRILGWAGDVEVLSPQSLREKVKKAIKEMSEMYGIT